MREVIWKHSATKHGIDPADVMWVITHPVVSKPIPDRINGGVVTLYLGYTNTRPSQLLEVVAHIDLRAQTVTIFHAMQMRAKWQYLLDQEQGRA